MRVAFLTASAPGHGYPMTTLAPAGRSRQDRLYENRRIRAIERPDSSSINFTHRPGAAESGVSREC
jgi:hypothetical protein